MPRIPKSKTAGPRRSASAACQPSPPATRDILLAVTGDSPAILTETIWFLATQAEDAFVPHEVLAVTTTRGKSAIEKQLLGSEPSAGGSTIWHALSQALAARGIPVEGRLQLRIRLIEQTSPKPGPVRELEDIRDRKENEAAADSILRVAQEVCIPERNRVVASIAGGRKAMGALLYAVMSLVGKEQDRVTHVLVAPPYDTKLQPMFYFPAQPVQELCDAQGNVHRAQDAKLDLAEVPFVVLRRRFGDLAKREPTFMALVRRHNAASGDLGADITLDVAKGLLDVDGAQLSLAPHHTLQIEFLLRLAQARLQPSGHTEACELFRVWRHPLTAESEATDKLVVDAQLLDRVRRLPKPRLAMSLPEEARNCLKKLSGEDYKDPLSKVRIWLRAQGSRWQMGSERAAYELPPGSRVTVRS
jgi:CRISPR-associated protein (TIGR02584 family)